MPHRMFEGKEQAAAYLKYRISPSETLIGKVVDFLEEKKGKPFGLAVDVGCGSGQTTVLLAQHFKQVIGTDISLAQLEMAKSYSSAPNVSYRESAAEDLPFADGSVDLVTSVTAAHWFDTPRFLKEVDRLLRPRGCLALLNYTMDMELQCGDEDCSRMLTGVCREFYDALMPYCHPGVDTDSATPYKHAFDSIPYAEKEWIDCVWERQNVTLGRYVGLMESWTNYQVLLKEDTEKARRLSQDITNKLIAAMGASSEETEVVLETEAVLRVQYFYMLACKP